MSYTDDLVRRINELEEEAVCFKKKTRALSDFLIANFRDGCDVWDGDLGTDIEIAVRLLGELKYRRELAAALAEINRLKEAGGIEIPHRWVATWDGEWHIR